jgi:hypothetical protein
VEGKTPGEEFALARKRAEEQLGRDVVEAIIALRGPWHQGDPAAVEKLVQLVAKAAQTPEGLESVIGIM